MNHRRRYLKIGGLVLLGILMFFSGKFYSSNKEEHYVFTSRSGFVPYIAQNCEVDETCIAIETTETKSKPEIVQKRQLTDKRPVPKGELLLEQLHQCKIDIDVEAVQRVQEVLIELNNEMALFSTQYKVNEFLTLKVLSPQLPDGFVKMLAANINAILVLYKRWLGLNLSKELTINLIIMSGHDSYIDVLSRLSIDSPQSQGLFWANSNFAFAAYKNIKQLKKTSLHESVHALNHALIGFVPRWLNEGLADYFKNIELTKKNGNYKVSFTQPKHNAEVVPLDISSLIFSDRQWNTEQRDLLYRSAFEHLSYLLNTRQDRNVVRRMVNEESKRPCTVLTNDTYSQMIFENTFDLYPTFDEWIDNKNESKSH